MSIQMGGTLHNGECQRWYPVRSCGPGKKPRNSKAPTIMNQVTSPCKLHSWGICSFTFSPFRIYRFRRTKTWATSKELGRMNEWVNVATFRAVQLESVTATFSFIISADNSIINRIVVFSADDKSEFPSRAISEPEFCLFLLAVSFFNCARGGRNDY